jgi:tetratricopeptide (TPR) repeat protein
MHPTSSSTHRTWLRAALAALLSLTLVVGAAGLASAQDAPKKKRRKEKSYTLQPTTMKRMAKVYEYIEEEDFDAAIDTLISIAKRRSLRKHDRAMVYRFMGFMYAQKEDYDTAVKALERSLKQDALPFSTEQEIKFALGQLYMAVDRMEDAVVTLQDWYDEAESPNADQHFRLAQAYLATERFDKALPYARKAVAMSTDEPKERFYVVNLATEFQLGNFLESLELLKLLAMHFPKEMYYKQLAFGYTELGEMETALAVLQLAYSEGWLDEERELLSLAQRFYSQDLPFQAAKVLQKGIDDGVIERSEKNLEFLSSALLSAREYEASLPPLAEAASLSESGDLYVRLAQVHLQVERWREAQEALEKAVAKGELKDPHRAQLLLGITHFNQKRYKSARVAFANAAKDENLNQSALQWMDHTDRQIRLAELEAEQQQQG